MVIDLLVYGGLGLLALGAYGGAVRRQVHNWRQHQDDEARRWLYAAVGFLLVAIAGCASIGASVLQLPIEVRRVLGGLAWGAFAAAGLLFLAASRVTRR